MLHINAKLIYFHLKVTLFSIENIKPPRPKDAISFITNSF